MKKRNITILDENSEKNICKDCGEEFQISSGEKAYYSSLDFQMPKRCADCRKKKKERNKYQKVETCAGVDL